MSIVAFPASAQVDCPFADSSAVGDTVSTAAYLPYSVGNEWHYFARSSGFPSHITVREVVDDTLVGDVTYSKIRQTEYDYDTEEVGRQFFLYIGVADSSVYRYDAIEDESYPDPIQPSFDFNSCYQFDGRAFGVNVTGDAHVYPYDNYQFTVIEHDEEVQYAVPRAKVFDLYLGAQAIVTATAVPGVGLTDEGAGLGESRLIYALLDGESIGTRADSTYAWIVTVGSSAPDQEHRLSGYPNPASSEYFLSLSGFREVRLSTIDARPAVVKVFDLLGRERMQIRGLAASTRVMFDVSALESGVYVIVTTMSRGKPLISTFVVSR